ncbi:MAG TPA: DNA mismatch repair endonuclease MutL [Methylomirabilota bacterium]|jgi:DNA mismatch repair protein MutL|nr:DNA mismatch repair endonuclease MutL [Methylomirabilota bacterium]
MSRIRLLPDHLVNKIAAGEVVERPASVVKELVENAIDAGSTAITVELKDAGRQLIRVTDDGMGMDAGDIELALQRHATSKIADEADLGAIASLGFRGEALPAICAVSRFQITSCLRGVTTGTRVRGAGGDIADRLAIEAPPGTTVETQDLFFNTPARLKFLRSAPAELAAALRLLEGLALARPDLRLRVIHNGRVTLMAPAVSSLRDRVGALRGFELAQAMLEVDRTQGSIRVEGLAVPPQLARGNRDEMTLIVNGRSVRDTALLQTLIEAYRPMLARHEFPSAVLLISLPPQELDVNVHPTKAWVRFRSPRLVQEAVFLATQDALRSRRVVQPQQGLATPAMDLDQALASSSESATFPQGGLFQETPAAYESVGPGRFGLVVGQLQDTFIVSASEEEVFFIDQHVAHERVLFEQLRRDLLAGPLPSQALLFPQSLDLGPGQGALLQQWAADLGRLGFALEDFGGRSVLLRAVPSLLKGEEPRRLIEELLGEVGGASPAEGAPLIDRALSFVACHAAIKAHAPLQREEMTRLIADLSGTDTPYFCPHGRPIVSRLSLKEIKRELRRTW